MLNWEWVSIVPLWPNTSLTYKFWEFFFFQRIQSYTQAIKIYKRIQWTGGHSPYRSPFKPHVLGVQKKYFFLPFPPHGRWEYHRSQILVSPCLLPWFSVFGICIWLFCICTLDEDLGEEPVTWSVIGWLFYSEDHQSVSAVSNSSQPEGLCVWRLLWPQRGVVMTLTMLNSICSAFYGPVSKQKPTSIISLRRDLIA